MLILRTVYLGVGVLVARWIFRRHLEGGDTLARLRSIGGI
jgi:hypothetical protein